MHKKIKYNRTFELLKEYMEELSFFEDDGLIIYTDGNIYDRWITLNHGEEVIYVFKKIPLGETTDKEIGKMLNNYLVPCDKYSVIFDYD